MKNKAKAKKEKDVRKEKETTPKPEPSADEIGKHLKKVGEEVFQLFKDVAREGTRMIQVHLDPDEQFRRAVENRCRHWQSLNMPTHAAVEAVVVEEVKKIIRDLERSDDIKNKTAEGETIS
ncbi:MAG: hypothetical protein A2934_05375 [Candidatus Sungbacteria bacterium RIFCSPLOWO2_01_FULL_47_10]|uniref:Uncharacterized protein n=1 Tax=Candidatus Sungbacteria bacterium RIFCSPLOWO2_01_FULL_47_10 TaxID=1802276 RepID=A0A1G2L499_9BACT|nr:MAG: hypothetical protein A2934_05375 [Candidatus Sungbacteria bacterium RIFCSPLOWO2_01_FULL_47_10]